MLDPVRIDDGFRRRPTGVALSTRETRRAHHRREERQRWITRRPISQRIIIQAGVPRSLGDSARNVTAAQLCRGITKHECRILKTKAGEIRAPSRKIIALSLFHEA